MKKFIEDDEKRFYIKHVKLFEDRLYEMEKYISFDEKNYKVFSLEITSIILDICGTIDSLLRVLCKNLDSTYKNNKNYTINDYFDILKETEGRFLSQLVENNAGVINISGWEKWKEKSPPSWWSEYNKIKHNRFNNFEKANLGNALESFISFYSLIYFIDLYELGDTMCNYHLKIFR